MKLKLRKSKDAKWYFVLVARNGRVVMTSETYNREASAFKSMLKLMSEFHIPLEVTGGKR